MARTESAPCCKRQSVKPPVLAPTSMQLFDVTSTSNSSHLRNNFNQNSDFSRSDYKSTSEESGDTLEDLIRDVEEV